VSEKLSNIQDQFKYIDGNLYKYSSYYFSLLTNYLTIYALQINLKLSTSHKMCMCVHVCACVSA